MSEYINKLKRLIVRMIRMPKKWRQQQIARQMHREQSLAFFEKHLAQHLDYENGFFIELGANDGIRYSNTLWLEENKNWRGLLIEPIPRLYKQAKRNRKKSIVLNCACVSTDYPDKHIKITDVDLMSVVEGAMGADHLRDEHIQQAQDVQKLSNADTLTVNAYPLKDLLEQHDIQEVDFLSLDVEGYEVEVLKGLDLHTYRPKLILAEVHFDHANQIDDILQPYYEKIAIVDEKNALYKWR